MPDLGVSARKNVDFSRERKSAVSVLLPSADRQEEFVKVVFSSDDGRRIRYVPLDLFSNY